MASRKSILNIRTNIEDAYLSAVKGYKHSNDPNAAPFISFALCTALERFFGKLKDVAKKEITTIAATEIEQVQEGEQHVVILSCTHGSVTLSVRNGYFKVDGARLLDLLTSNKGKVIDNKLIAELTDKVTSRVAGARTFTPVLED